MAINKNCLEKLLKIGLPMEVEVLSRHKQQIVLGKAVINVDGTVTYLKNLKNFSSPSSMRNEIVCRNCATYKHIRYNGKLLSELGVCRD